MPSTAVDGTRTCCVLRFAAAVKEEEEEEVKSVFPEPS